MKKKIIYDTALNIFASVIPLFALQFLILPLVARTTDPNSYGRIIAIVAFLNLISGTFGNVLNNSRLISWKSDKVSSNPGNFNHLLIILLPLASILILISSFYYDMDFDFLSVPLIMLSSLFLLLNGYQVVKFRIKLNFKYIFLSNFILFIGYLIGYYIYTLTSYWQFIYFTGFFLSFIFITIKSRVYKEPFVIDNSYKLIRNQTLVIFTSGILLSLATYADKILIYPILGGYAVAVYYSSTLVAKTVGMVATPISGVLLSYLAQFKKFENRKFFFLVMGSSVFSLLSLIFIMFIGKPLLTYLYPMYVDDAMKYLLIVSIGSLITISTAFINTAVMKFRQIKYQLMINAIFVISYFLFSLLLLYKYDLYGFAVGILIATIIKLFSVFSIFYFTLPLGCSDKT